MIFFKPPLPAPRPFRNEVILLRPITPQLKSKDPSKKSKKNLLSKIQFNSLYSNMWLSLLNIFEENQKILEKYV